jgi:feruloyl-CoA synthase
MAAFNATAGGSSRRVSRFTVLTEPPSIDAGEITDKGYVNQRATLERRAGGRGAVCEGAGGGRDRDLTV